MENNNNGFFNRNKIGVVSFDKDTLTQKLKLLGSLFTQPMKVIEIISTSTQIDLMQIIIATGIAVIFSLITSGMYGLGVVVGMPLTIILGGIFFLVISIISGGRIDYIKVINFATYLALLISLASSLRMGRVIMVIASIQPAIYCIYLQYIGISYLTGSKKEVIKVICIIELALIAVGYIAYFLQRVTFIIWALLMFVSSI